MTPAVLAEVAWPVATVLIVLVITVGLTIGSWHDRQRVLPQEAPRRPSPPPPAVAGLAPPRPSR